MDGAWGGHPRAIVEMHILEGLIPLLFGLAPLFLGLFLSHPYLLALFLVDQHTHTQACKTQILVGRISSSLVVTLECWQVLHKALISLYKVTGICAII